MSDIHTRKVYTLGLWLRRPWWPQQNPGEEWRCPHGERWSNMGNCDSCAREWKTWYTGSEACLRENEERR